MDIETKIALGFLICFVAGLIGGWYAIWQTYHQDKKRQEAFNEGLQFALDKKRTLPPPPTKDAVLCKIIRDLNLIPVDEYFIRFGGDMFIKTPSNQPTEDEIISPPEDA
jgi:hypothetical protein